MRNTLFCTPEDRIRIDWLMDRASAHMPDDDLILVRMCLESYHKYGDGLDLEGMMAAEDAELVSDVRLIESYLDRETNRMTGDRDPRFKLRGPNPYHEKLHA